MPNIKDFVSRRYTEGGVRNKKYIAVCENTMFSIVSVYQNIYPRKVILL